MSEAYSWREAEVQIWTGTATASAAVALAENTRLSLAHGWDNRPSLSGVYRDHLTGQVAQLSIGAFYSNDWTIGRVFTSATAVHMKINQYNVYGSAGFLLYSGRIDGFDLEGNNGQVWKFNVRYHANRWSSYGGNS